MTLTDAENTPASIYNELLIQQRYSLQVDNSHWTADGTARLGELQCLICASKKVSLTLTKLR